MNPLLDVKNLYVRFKTPDGTVTAVNDLNFTLNAGSTLGIVGESGSGKSQTAFALMGLLAANGTVEGSAIFEGKELVNLPKAELNKIRAEQISMIFQDPMTSLNPYMKIGEQLMEVLDTLTEREQKVLRLRFGLDDGRPRTLEEVGRQFNVTRERIRQIEAKALRKLRHPSRSKKLKDYLDE